MREICERAWSELEGQALSWTRIEGSQVSICLVDSNQRLTSNYLSFGLKSTACERSIHITTLIQLCLFMKRDSK